MDDAPKYAVEATETSLFVLETLVEHDGPLGVTALADRIDVSKSVVHNHLSTLRARGYVIKRSNGYEPSLRTLNLGNRTREGLTVYQYAKQALDNLAAASGETTILFVLEEDTGVATYISEPANGWNPSFREGERIPLYVNAPGKSILASIPNDRVNEILNTTKLDTHTDATVTEIDTLRDQINRIRDDGIAFCREEQYDDIIGVASPIVTDEANRAAAIGLYGPVERLNGRYLEEDITGQVLSTAKSIQVTLTGN